MLKHIGSQVVLFVSIGITAAGALLLMHATSYGVSLAAALLIGATLLGSMGAWGRTVYRFEGNPMVVVTWRALIGVAVLASILGFARQGLMAQSADDGRDRVDIYTS